MNPSLAVDSTQTLVRKDQSLDVCFLEELIQIGADKSAVAVFFDDRFTRQRRIRLIKTGGILADIWRRSRPRPTSSSGRRKAS
jgi:hypothetical protein